MFDAFVITRPTKISATLGARGAGMKTPRALARCCGRRRCIPPFVLSAALLYLAAERWHWPPRTPPLAAPLSAPGRPAPGGSERVKAVGGSISTAKEAATRSEGEVFAHSDRQKAAFVHADTPTPAPPPHPPPPPPL